MSLKVGNATSGSEEASVRSRALSLLTADHVLFVTCGAHLSFPYFAHVANILTEGLSETFFGKVGWGIRGWNTKGRVPWGYGTAGRVLLGCGGEGNTERGPQRKLDYGIRGEVPPGGAPSMARISIKGSDAVRCDEVRLLTGGWLSPPPRGAPIHHVFD